MAGGVVRVVPGRHIRRAELEGVRRVSLAALIMLVVQYGLGIILNLYIAVPASDAHAGLVQEIASGPLMLTVHALLGLALIGAALRAAGPGRAPRGPGDRRARRGGPDRHRRGVRVGRDLRAQRSVGCFAGHGPADRGGAAVLHRRADLGQHQQAGAGPVNCAGGEILLHVLERPLDLRQPPALPAGDRVHAVHGAR